MAQQNPVDTRQPARQAESGSLVTPFEQMERMLDDYMPGRLWRRLRPEWPALNAGVLERFPKVDVIDRDAEVVVRAEIPGVEKKDLDISLNDGAVTIRGETRHEEHEEKGDFYRCELMRGSFARTVPLPTEVDGDTVKASFKDGVLELVMRKVEKSTRRSIKLD